MKGENKMIIAINNEDSVNDELVELRKLAEDITFNCNSIQDVLQKIKKRLKLDDSADVEHLIWVATTCAMLVKKDLKRSKAILGKDYLKWVKERLHFKSNGLHMINLLSTDFSKALKTVEALIRSSLLSGKIPNAS